MAGPQGWRQQLSDRGAGASEREAKMTANRSFRTSYC